MRILRSRVLFFILTALLIGGFPNFMSQEAYAAAVTGLTNVNLTNNESGSADFTVDYRIIDDDAGVTDATAGTITFTRTGGSADATGHVYTMQVADLSANTAPGELHQLSRITLEGDAGFNSLVSGTIYTIDVALTAPTAFSYQVTGFEYDTTKPTMSSATVTSTTTIDVTFSEDILDAEAADFTLDGGLTVSGVAENNGVVTITTNEIIAAGVTPTITLGGDFVTDVINEGTANTAIAGNVTASNANQPATGGGSGCDDCEAPTLGVDKKGTRLVSNGFTYNGNSVDAERFFTPYPLITANVGKTNVAQFKLYENEGVSNIRHFALAFGMDKGDIISDSKAKIELDIDHEGTETVTVTDPENVLDNIKVTTSTVSCMDDSYSDCLGISIQHRFRAPLDFNIVGTDVWDSKRNAWQNTFNHGIEVVGDSLNPAKKYDGINKGHIYHLTEIGKTTAVDEFGNPWTLEYGLWNMDYIDNKNTPVTLFLKEIIPADGGFAGSDQFGTMYYFTETSEITAVDMFGNHWSLESGLWTMDLIYSQMILDGTPMGGYTRDDSEFNIYKYGQSVLAENKLNEICSDCFDETFGEIDNIFAYDFPVTD